MPSLENSRITVTFGLSQGNCYNYKLPASLVAKFHFFRPVDKKKIVYYHDANDDFEVHDDFVKLWRQVTVDGKDIDEYLSKNGITSMQDHGLRVAPLKRKKINRAGNRRKKVLKDNLHIAGDLEDYTEMTTQAYKK